MKNNEKNVEKEDAAKLIKTIATEARTCLMITNLDKEENNVRPMAIQKADDYGRIYFFSKRESNKNKELKANNRMQLTIQNDSKSAYISLFGKGHVYRDQKEIDEMYSAFANTWFDGKEDPELSLIRFDAETGHYWDSKHGKIVQMAGILLGAITGKQTDDGVQGEIKI